MIPNFYGRKIPKPPKSLNKMSKQNEVETVGNKTPTHYNNKNGSLYKIALDRNWNAYQFDAVKRIDRCEKKGEFESDIDKTIEVLKMYKLNK